MLFSPVSDQYARNARARQMLRGKLCHFARADNHDRAISQFSENLSSKLDRHVADGDSRGRDARLSSDALGDAESLMDKTIENAPGCPGLDRERIGMTHLAQDLRLADNHRVE